MLVLGMLALRSADCLQSSRHASDELAAEFNWDLVPFHRNSLPELLAAFWRSSVVAEPNLEVRPHVLNWVKVWRLCWPV